MNNNPLNNSIRTVKGVGPKRAELFEKLGVVDVRSLIYFYPRDYRDLSEVSSITSAPFGVNCTVRATVIGPMIERRTHNGKMMYTGIAGDGKDSFKIIIFNNRFAAEKLKVGKTFIFYGKMGGNYTAREMLSPIIEEDDGNDKIQPVYRMTSGLNSKAIGRAVQNALELADEVLVDPLPEDFRKKHKLCDLKYALHNIHFPADKDALEKAKRRVSFEELFTLQLGMLMFKGKKQTKTRHIVRRSYCDEYLKQLPFAPTGAQLKVIDESVRDMSSGLTMNRIIQGDVGSGKTLVAAALMYTAAKNGMQSAFMVPTEILAVQHYNNLSGIFERNGIKTALLIGSLTAANKRVLYEKMAAGDVDIIIGTNALMQNKATYKNLGLVITDEQHRFGVGQRSALASKGDSPHTLVMSATPIPRTLSHVIFGDLDISVIDQMPSGRKPVKTYAVTSEYRRRIFEYIRKTVQNKKQVYIVCPAIEESEMPLESATEYYENLRDNVFKDLSIGLLHGRVQKDEKDEIMERFVKNEIQILVSTTVIEVGVDVKNATLMVIENADRFGLSQLHQLRGRVGRSSDESACILVSDNKGEETKKRLKIICENTDGFKIADEDLKLRGPGDFFGERQHGLPKLKSAELVTDGKLVKETADAAQSVLKSDPRLETPQNRYLKLSVKRMFKNEFYTEA